MFDDYAWQELQTCIICMLDKHPDEFFDDETCDKCQKETERYLCPGCAEEVYNAGEYCKRCEDRSRQQPIFDESWGDSRPWHSGPIDRPRNQM